MFNRTFQHLRGNLVAYVALFLALGGTSFAATAFINGSQIKPHTIAKNRLTSQAIRQLKGNRGLQGPAGLRGVTGPQGPKGDPTYKRTILVSPVGTDLQNGAALRAALASITDASATKPYLLKLEPGTYNLDTTGLALKPYVDLEGSGSSFTIIRAAVNSASSGALVATPTVTVTLRSFTVNNLLPSPTGISTGVFVPQSAGVNLTDVAAGATGGATAYGLYAHGGNPGLVRSILFGTTAGLYADSSAGHAPFAFVRESDVDGFQYGLYMATGEARVLWSRLQGQQTYDAFIAGPASASFGATQFRNNGVHNDGTVSCAQSFAGENPVNDVGSNCA